MKIRVCVANLALTVWLVAWFLTTLCVACVQTKSCGAWEIPSVSELIGRNVLSTGLLLWTVSTYLAVRIGMVACWYAVQPGRWLHSVTLVAELLRLSGLLLLALVTWQLDHTIHMVGAYIAGGGSVAKGFLRAGGEQGTERWLHLALVTTALVLLLWFVQSANGWMEMVALLCIAVENLFDGIDYGDYQVKVMMEADRENTNQRSISAKSSIYRASIYEHKCTRSSERCRTPL